MPRSKNLVEILITAKNLAGGELKKTEGQMSDLEDQVKKTGTAMLAAGTAIAGALLLITQQTAKTVDEYKKFERATGISVKTLASLRFAIQRWGGSQRDADTALRRMTKAIADGGSGLESYVRVWRRLNISTEELVKPDGSLATVEELLPLVADKFRTLEDATLKADAAQILWGRGGLRIIPLMNQGAEGIERMGERAKRLGRFFSEDMLKAAEAFQDANLDLKQSIEGVGFAIGGHLMPSVTNAMNRITEMVIRLRTWIEINGDVIKGVAALAVGLMGAGGLLLAVTAIVGSFRILTVTLGAAGGPLGILLGTVGLLAALFAKIKIEQLAQPRTLGDITRDIDKRTEAIAKVQDKIAVLQAGGGIGAGGGSAGAGGEAEGMAEKWQEIKGAVKDVTGYSKTETELLEDANRELERQNENLKALQSEHDWISKQKDRELAQEKALADLERLKLKRIQQLRASLADNDAMFEAELAAGMHNTSDAIERQIRKVAELKEEKEATQKVTEGMARNDEQFTQRTEETIAALELYAAGLSRLIALKQQLRDETERLFEEMSVTNEAILASTTLTLMEIDGVVHLVTQNLVIANRIMASALGSGLQAAMSRVMAEGNKWRDSWNALWRGMLQTVISAVSQMIAKIVALKIIMAILPGSSFIPGASMFAGIGNVLIGHTGGTLQGSGNIPLLAQGGENLIDRNSNDRLNEFLDSVEGGGAGGGNVIINAGFYTGTKQENKVFQDFQRRSSAGFERRHIARGMR